MAAIYRRELRSYFTGITGYLFIAIFLIFVGIYTVVINFSSAYATFEYTLYNVSFIYLIITPILTMRALAEDRRQHTMELLYSLPLKLSNIVLGKYFAMLTVLGIPCAVMCFYPLILSLYGTMDFGTTYSTILAFFLLGAALCAVGLFMSSLTENQIISAVLCFGVVLLFYLMSSLSYYLPTSAYGSYVAFVIVVLIAAILLRFLTKSSLFALIIGVAGEAGLTIWYIAKPDSFAGSFASAAQTLSVFDRMTNFVSGIFDVSLIVYFLAVAALGVFFSVLSLEKRRWS